MSSSILNHKFLLDENVNIKLLKLLKDQGLDVRLVPKSASDLKVASISKVEDRILVTNDEDFSYDSEEELFSVVWLHIPQNDLDSLITSFEKLLRELKVFKGKIVTLKPKSWYASPMIVKVKLGKSGIFPT